MKFHDEFSPRPLIHAHLYVVAKKISAGFSRTATQEFWYLPANALGLPSKAPLDWVLAEVVVGGGRMLGHRPIVAVNYDPDVEAAKIENADNGMCFVRVGPRTDPDETLEATLYRLGPHSSRTRRAVGLTLPHYQGRLRASLNTGKLVALNEVAVSAVGQLSESLRKSIHTKVRARHNIALDHIPGARRFDLVVATPPPMCFAVAAIEIDGPTHERENAGDRIKEEFCRSTGLPLIRIGIGSHLTSDTNQNQDDFQGRFADWIARTVSGLDVDVQLMQFFLEAIRAVAEGAAPEVRSDLLALTDTSVSISSRLSEFIAGTLDDETPYPPEEELQWSAEDESGYEAVMAMVPVHEQGLPNLTRVNVVPRRDGDLLFFDVNSAWTGSAQIASRWEQLPPLRPVGPLSIRLISPEVVRNKFFRVASAELAAIVGGVVEGRARELLQIKNSDDYWRVRERWKLLAKLNQRPEDLGSLEVALVKYLGNLPSGRWGEVPLTVAERAKARAAGESQEGVRRKLLLGEKEPMVSAPRAVCEGEWGWRRRHFATKASIVREVISDDRLPIEEDVRELLVSLVEEREAVWVKYDEWSG